MLMFAHYYSLYRLAFTAYKVTGYDCVITADEGEATLIPVDDTGRVPQVCGGHSS